MFSAFVVDALGGMCIVAMNAVQPGGAKITVKPKGYTGEPPKGRGPTVKQKTAAGMV